MAKRGRKNVPCSNPDELRRLVAEGLTRTAICRRIGAHAKQVRRWLLEHGLEASKLVGKDRTPKGRGPIYTSQGKTWQRLNTAEKLAAIITPRLLQSFWERVSKGGADECWLWTGSIHPARGYGRFSFSNMPLPAHRACWMIHNGVIPADMFVCHRCDNPPCVNPAHLFLGTNQDNYDDRDTKGRVRHGSSHPRAKLTEELVIKIRASKESDSVWAKRLGMYATAIRDARRGAKWKRVPGANPGFYERDRRSSPGYE